MMQEFNVVRCFSCRIFQVQQVKKSTNKWTCKLCNAKQSLKNIFFQGTGKECRVNCQKLNIQQQGKDEKENQFIADVPLDVLFPANDDKDEVEDTSFQTSIGARDNKASNKWECFVEQQQLEDEDEDEQECNRVIFRGEEKKKSRKRKPSQGQGHRQKSIKYTPSADPCDTQYQNTPKHDNYSTNQPRHQTSNSYESKYAAEGSKYKKYLNTVQPIYQSTSSMGKCDDFMQSERGICSDVNAGVMKTSQGLVVMHGTGVTDQSNVNTSQVSMTTGTMFQGVDGHGVQKNLVTSKNVPADSKWSKFLTVEEDLSSEDEFT